MHANASPISDLRSLEKLPRARASRLTHARLRRPTPLPAVRARAGFSSYLQRLLWLFSGR
jgi:hypothetical protein